MSTRLKVLIQLLMAQMILMGGIYWALQISVHNGHAQLEERFLKDNHSRLHSGMKFAAESLALLVADWAEWDDTYEFMERPFDPTDPYVVSNLTPDILSSIDIELLLYLDVEGAVVVGKQTDRTYASTGPVNPELIKNLSAKMTSMEKYTGYFYTNHDLWLVVSSPVLNSAKEGPARGRLTMGWLADEPRLDQVAQRELLSMQFHELPTIGYEHVVEQLLGGADIVIDPVSDSEVHSFQLFSGIAGEPIALVELTTSRDIMKQGNAILRSVLGAMLLVGLAITLITLFLQDRIILRPLSVLSQQLHRIRESQDLSKRVDEAGESELGYFAQSFNELMTSIQKSEQTLRTERDRVSTTLSSIQEAVITTDNHAIVDYINPEAERITGWRMDQCRGQPLDRIFCTVNDAGKNPQKNIALICLETNEVVRETEYNMLINRNGGRFFIEEHASPIHESGNTCLGVVVVFRDVTLKKELNAKLLHQASHDPLTNLHNRSYFERCLMDLKDERSLDPGLDCALLYIDLDQFKLVNDSCGHAAGDGFLFQIAGQMKSQVRSSDVLARLGGDEFGIILRNCDRKSAYSIAEKIRVAVENFRFTWSGTAFSAGVSIGLVNFSDVEDADQVLGFSDIACYMAKNEGRNRIHEYQPETQQLETHKGQVNWTTKLSVALQENRFVLFEQEIRSLKALDKPATRSEILIRMLDEDGEIILPGAFLPAAERFGLIRRIDRWVIDNFLSWFSERRAEIDPNHVYSLNLSGHTLGDQSMLDFVGRCFEEYSVPYDQICFEVTETSAVHNLSRATGFMADLREKGCRFALDDFGTGVCSFAYLKSLPVDELKIDGSFVRNIATQPVEYALVRSMNEIGHVLGLLTVGEFVENDDIAVKLQEIGVDFAQGYGIAKPRPLSTGKC